MVQYPLLGLNPPSFRRECFSTKNQLCSYPPENEPPKVLRLIFWEDNYMQYSTGKHCVFYHRYHLVWSMKYRYKVLRGDIKLRVRDICRQVCAENGVDIIRGVLSNDHVHMFVLVPPKLAISDLMRLMKGRSSYKVQREFPHLKKRYWGQRFWGRGYF